MPTLQVTTSFGDVEVYVHDSNRISLRSENTSPVVINRVPLAFGLELERVEVSGHRAEIGNTGWTYGHTSWTVHPENWRKMSQYPTMACRSKVSQMLIPQVIAALSESPDLFDDAERERLERDLSTKAAAVARLRDQLAEALVEAENAQQALINYNSAGVMA
jgi:hypothetical protein